MVMDISNAEKIFTFDNVYSEIEGIKVDYINGRQFVKFSCNPLGGNRRKIVAVEITTITKVEFKDTVISNLNTVQDVVNAFRDGRLVGR